MKSAFDSQLRSTRVTPTADPRKLPRSTRCVPEATGPRGKPED